MEGALIHWDVVSNDPKASRKFFEDTFRFKFKKIPFAGYALFEAPGPPHGGLRGSEPELTQAPSVVAYLAVDSLEEARDRILKAGGTVVSKVMKVPGFGRYILFREPGGVVFGAFEEKI